MTVHARRLGAAALASALAIGCGSSSPGAPSSSAADADLVFCVTETNRYRATINRAPLVRSGALEAHAALAAAADAASGRAHGYFADSHAGNGLVAAENELLRFRVTSTIQTIIRDGWSGMWSEGPGGGHYEHMASSRFTQVGCGFASLNGTTTVVQDFR